MLRENLSTTLKKYDDRIDGSALSITERPRFKSLKSSAPVAEKTGTQTVLKDSFQTLVSETGTADPQNNSHEPATHKIAPEIWQSLDAGIHQRFRAINAFLDAVLTKSSLPEFVRRDAIATEVIGRIPRTLQGLKPWGGSWTNFASTDLYIGVDGQPLVLDHNLACPIGLQRLTELSDSVVLRENATGLELVDRWISHRLRPELRQDSEQEDIASRMRIAILDSGAFSPAFRENEFLAIRTGGTLVRSRDLVIDNDGVALIQHGQTARIDLLLRRMDDDLLDPNCFRPDSLVGVPGLVRLCRDGKARVLNAPGTGLINNRAISRLIPEMIRWYLRETPLLPSVETLVCGNSSDRDLVLSNLDRYAIRTIDPLHPSRPVFGSVATAAERADIVARLLRDSANFVARPLLPEEFGVNAGTGRRGFHLRTFAGLADGFELLPMAIGRANQPDGGATLSIISDPTTFLVHY